jgi:hypothetical protein
MKRSSQFGIAAIALLCAGLAPLANVRAQNGPPAAPVPGPGMLRFAFGGNVAQLPAEFIGNLIFVPARINQSQPSMFQLDTTAAASAVDPDRAAELGIANSRSPVLNLTNVDVVLPALTSASNPDFASRLGRLYQGTVGDDVLSNAVLEIDYERQTVRIYDPRTYNYKGKAKAMPLVLRDGLPAVRAKVEIGGHKSGEALFQIDTGLDVPLLISDRFAREHHFFHGHVRTFPIAPGELGIPGNAVMARTEVFQLGQYEIAAPLAAFVEGKLPGGDDSQLAGEIGGGMLRRFTVTLDFARKEAFFDGNGQIRADDHEDMSGISVAAGGPGLKTVDVVQVRPGSAAAEAGVQKGDTIEGIDDEAASDISVTAVRALFTQVGHKYKLLINRNGKTLTLNVTMRRSL